MARAVDVGQWIIETKSRFVGHVALQKLAYFGQVWSLVWTGRRLVEDEFQAWPMGPVAYDLYRDFKYRAPNAPIAGAAPETLSADEVATLEAVYAFYSRYTGAALAEMSHDAAWTDARDGLKPEDPSNEEIDLTLAVREYTRKALLGSDVPTRPAGLRPRNFDVADTLLESARQDARWHEVHERLASA